VTAFEGSSSMSLLWELVPKKVGRDPGDPELLPQPGIRKTKLSPITSLIDLIWPAVISDLFPM